MKDAGFSLIELGVVVVIIAILALLGLARFGVATEQVRLDIAAARLLSIGIAQRMYWLEEGTYAGSLGDLSSRRLIDSAITTASDPYGFSVAAADVTSFQANAVRAGSSSWSGALTLDELGTIEGEVENEDGRSITPAGN